MSREPGHLEAEQAKILMREALRAPDHLTLRGKPYSPPRMTDAQLGAWDERRRAKNVGLRPHELRELKKRSKGNCYLCSQPLNGDQHVEHIIPISRGGEHTLANLDLAHPACNLAKNAFIVSFNVATRQAEYHK